MSSKKTHLDQAEHNAKVANSLVDGEYYDWSCTCAFYAAIHFVEAKFADIPEILHTDKVYEDNKDKFKDEGGGKSIHWYREFLVGQKLPNTVRLAYGHLKATSEMCRYLRGQDKKACDLISKEDAKKLVREKLTTVKTQLGF